MTTTCATTIPADAADPVRVIVRCLCGGIISEYVEPGITHWVQCWRCQRQLYMITVYAEVATTSTNASM